VAEQTAGTHPTLDDLPEGTVTVLFSDVEGSTDLRTREGDDVAQEVMRTHERLLREQLPAFGGREVVFMGDGFMVAFASARKALECAIAIQRAFEQHNQSGPTHPIKVRIGLNSGEVLRESGTLYGTAVNAAARVSAKARGEQILVSQVTRDLTAGVKDFSFLDRGMHTLKGFPTQWRLSELAWREAASGPATAETGTPTTPATPRHVGALEETFVRPSAAGMVGRQIERAALEQDLEAVAAGSIRVFAIEGEPGIGKTRLMESAIQAATDRGFGAIMVGGDEELRGPFFMLRTLLGSSTIEALADQAMAREVLEQARTVLWGRREANADAAGLTPAEQTLRIYDAATLALRQIAETRPIVLLFDDLQWGDEDSLKLIRYLIRTSVRSPILIMLAHRPDPAAAPSAATMLVADLDRMRLVRRMALERFNRAETAELLENLLGHPVSQECAATLHARGEGVPFFIVEFAQTFREAGMFQLVQNKMEVSAAARATVAPSVQILIERRLAQLPAATRVALTDAAVIGRRFRLSDLARVRGSSDPDRDADAVVADELAPALEANLLAPLPDEAAYDYGFTHDEVRAVLQAQGNKQRHRAVHASLVDLMTSEDYPEECLATVAFHALEAGDEERGVRFSIEGARKALQAFAPEEALRSVDAARRASASPEDRARLLCLRDDALDALGLPDERLATLSEMAAFARALNDEVLELEATLRRASATRQTGDGPHAAEIAREAIAKAEARGDEPALLRAYLELGQAQLGSELGDGYSPPAGDGVDIGGAEETYAKAWELARKLDDLPTMAAVRREQGVVVIGRVRRFIQDMVDANPDLLKDPTLDPHTIPEIVDGFEQFRVYANEAVEMYEKLGDQRGVMSSLIAYAYANVIEDTTHGHAGRVEQIRRLRRNLSRMTSQSEIFQNDAYMLYSVHVYARGHGPADLELARGIETYEAARAIGMSNLEFLAAGGVALAYAGLGDVTEAETWVGTAGAAALSSANALPERQLETWRGQVRAAAGDAAGMRRHWERALTLASERGSPAGRCEVLATLAMGCARFGADLDDGSLLAAAEVWANEAIKLSHALPESDAPWLGEAEAALGQVARARGDLDAAFEHGMASVDELHRTRQLFAFLYPEWRLLTARAVEGFEDPRVTEFLLGVRMDFMMATFQTADDSIRAKWLASPIVAELAGRSGLGEAVRQEDSGATVEAELSERGVLILRRVMAGETNKKIAAALELDESEVAKELSAVYEALGVSSRAQMSVAALRKGIA
jgi:class 3 adenylate cyclase/tetratricopeptide (TPR) repeat protein/DNA-binding CsgD family transcriptional regulator